MRLTHLTQLRYPNDMAMSLEHESDSPLAIEVRKAGSQVAFGKKIGRRQSTIHQWLKKGQVPAEDVGDVADRLGIAAAVLRPDLAEVFQTPRAPETLPGAALAAGSVPTDPVAGAEQISPSPSGREDDAPAAVPEDAAGAHRPEGNRS